VAPTRAAPPENVGAAACQIFDGTPARQPDFTAASRKRGGGAAEGSTRPSNEKQIQTDARSVYFETTRYEPLIFTFKAVTVLNKDTVSLS